MGLGLALLAGLLSGCAETGESDKETIRFTFSKREAIGFMTKLVADYNASQDETEVVLDTSGVDVVSASFVRGNPPDIALANYNMETSRFVQRGALSDLSGRRPHPASARTSSRSWNSTVRIPDGPVPCRTRSWRPP